MKKYVLFFIVVFFTVFDASAWDRAEAMRQYQEGYNRAQRDFADGYVRNEEPYYIGLQKPYREFDSGYRLNVRPYHEGRRNARAQYDDGRRRVRDAWRRMGY